MKILLSRRFMGLFISLALIFALCVTFSPAQQKIKVAGKLTCAITKLESINFDDTEDHTIALMKYEGINFSTGEHEFMNGGQTVGVTFGDLIKGTGPHQGYGKMSLNGDVVFWKYKGKTTTTLSPKGKPIATFEGTLTWNKGAGQYENIQGSATYKGKYLTEVIWVTKWEGEYFIKK